MIRSMLTLLLVGTLAFWTLGCESNAGHTGEPGSSPDEQRPAHEPGS